MGKPKLDKDRERLREQLEVPVKSRYGAARAVEPAQDQSAVGRLAVEIFLQGGLDDG
jgi:hypothetical protein